MACWRWLLLLWQLSWFHMAESGFTNIKISDHPGQNNVTVPDDGIYVVSVSVDSCYGCRPALDAWVTLRKPGFSLGFFTVHAMDIVSHAEAAIALKQNDTLTLAVSGSMQDPDSFSVAYVSGLDGHYTTVVITSPSNSALLHFNKQLTANSWSGLSGNEASSFFVPTTGMYWVTARVVPVNSMFMTVTTENSTSTRILFKVFGKKSRSVSCSGAFRLSAGSVVKAKNPFTTTYATDTMLSFVYLEGNRKPYTGPDEHIAFTGFLTSKLQYKQSQIVPFPDHRTNYGRLYANDGHITIRNSGSYIISLRPDPPADASAVFDLFVNDRLKWKSSSKMGVPSGQTVSMVLNANDTLKVLSQKTGIIETHSLFSVAFLRS